MMKKGTASTFNSGMDVAAHRIQCEILEFARRIDEYRICPIDFYLKDDDLTELTGKITGPSGTPYEGGEFMLDIKVPSSYPYKPLEIRFNTFVWHPNVDLYTGEICVDILNGQWTPAMSIRSTLLSLQSLMGMAQNEENITYAKYWTHVFAKGPHAFPEFEEKARELCSKIKNLTLNEARFCLTKSSWNFEIAAYSAIHLFENYPSLKERLQQNAAETSDVQ